MPPARNRKHIASLVRELCNLPHETEWVEFKVNYALPNDIGEYISALANGAALSDKPYAYLVWGVQDKTHAIVGTSFSPSASKVGNEPLENWLLRKLTPEVDFRFHEVTVEERRVILLEIDRALRYPVSFGSDEFIRVGSVKKKLRDYPQKESALWRIFDQVTFEDGIADTRLDNEAIMRKLDYPAYFDLLETPLPDGRAAILDALLQDKLIARCEAGGWDVTNLGAILFAKKVSDFPGIGRKAVRIIKYLGTGRIDALREHEDPQGYAVGFQGIIGYIMALALERSNGAVTS